MRLPTQAAAVCLLWALLFVGSPPAGAAGTIDQTGATFDIGAGTPSGATVIDPNAPDVPVPTLPPISNIGSIGTMTGALPPFPGAGSGADGVFMATGDMALAGGTFNFSSYTILAGGSVTYDSATTIHVTGDVSIDGSVRSTVDGAGIEFRCGGTFDFLGNGTTPNEINVSGMGAGITIHAGEDAILGSAGFADGAQLRATAGTISVISHGLAASDGDVTTRDLRVVGSLESFEAQAAGEIDLADTNIFSRDGILLQAFGTDVRADAILSSNDAIIRVEAVSGVTLTSSFVDASDGFVFLKAFGGDLVLEASTTVSQSDGDVTAHAAGGVRINGGSRVSASGASIDVRAFGGSIAIGESGSGNARLDSSSGDITLMASADVTLDNGQLEGSAGDFIVRAFGGSVSMTNSSDAETSSGLFDMRANTSIFIGDGQCFGAGATRFSAGSGGIDVTSSELNGDEGGLDVLSTGPVRLRTSVFSEGDVLIRSTGGDVDVTDTSLRSANAGAAPSPSLNVEAWQPACILASNASFQTGTSNVDSGDINLLIHGAAGPPSDVKSFFLPKVVKVKVNGDKPEKSRLIAAGFFDVGPGTPQLTGEATLDVGNLQITADLEVAPNGKSVGLTGPGIDLQIKPAGSGSSRAKFRLSVKGAEAANMPTDGELALRLQVGAIDGHGRVVVENGKYKLGKTRGLLIEPVVFPFFAKATVKGGGRDSFSFRAGIATDDEPPAQADGTTITFTGLEFTIPSEEFTEKKPGVFQAKNPPSAPGVTKVILDYNKELVSLSAKDVDVGDIAEGPFGTIIGVQLGDAARTVEVTATRKGKKVKY